MSKKREDRQKEIAELQEKVFGKGISSRTFYVSDDQVKADILGQKDPGETAADASDASDSTKKMYAQLKEMQKRNDALSGQLAQLSQDAGLGQVDLNQLQSEIKKDFGVEVEMNDDGTFTKKAAVSMKAFEGVDGQLQKAVVGQNGMASDLVIAFKRPYVLKKKGDKVLNTILLMGPKGTGKTYALNVLAEKLAARGILEDPTVACVDLSRYTTSEDEKLFLQDVYAAVQQKGQVIEFIHAEACYPALLSYVQEFFIRGKMDLKKRYFLNEGQLVEAHNALLSFAVDSLEAGNHFLVFETDLKKSKLIDLMGAQFMNSFADVVVSREFDARAVDELIRREEVELIQKSAGQLGIQLTVDEKVSAYAKDRYDAKTGIYGIRDVMDTIFRALTQLTLTRGGVQQVRVTEGKSGLVLQMEKEKVKVSDLVRKEDPLDLEEVKKELDAIVGLQPVKDYVMSLKDLYQVQERREREGLKSTEVNRHMIFLGNPGTGKTTIARIISKYLRAIGVLSGGQLVEVTRGDLVGQYVGHTAPLTMKVLKSALGGVLFIDEAYSLYRGKDDIFGLECIDTLVKGIEDYRDDLIVILAGYEKEMGVFLTANTGLKSRFPNVIHFPDYTPQELLEISRSIARSRDYVILPECDQDLLAFYAKTQSDPLHVSGNGRTARNKVEEAILRQSRRLLREPGGNLRELKREDFNLEGTSFVE